MGKLYLYYKNQNDSQLGDMLKIKIDDTIKTEVKKNEICELEMADGRHNAKMYFQGWSSDELAGYIDEDIDIAGNSYYVYHAPIIIYNKGKLEKKNLDSPEAFRKYVTKKNKIYKMLGVILFIIALLVVIFLF